MNPKQKPVLDAARRARFEKLSIFRSDDNMEEFEAVVARLSEPYENLGAFEQDILDRAIVSEWRYLRQAKLYETIKAMLLRETPDESCWTKDQHRKLKWVLDHKTMLARSVKSDLKQLADYQRYRRAEARDKEKAALRARPAAAAMISKPQGFDLLRAKPISDLIQ